MKIQKQIIKKKLCKLALKLRAGKTQIVSKSIPRLIENDKIFHNGKLLKRKRIILRSLGCSIATCTMCPFTNETLFGSNLKLTAKHYITQFEYAFTNDNIDNYDMICVYNDGNFFSEKELPSEARSYILNRVATSQCQVFTVESLPQFVTNSIINETTEILGHKKLCVGIGLQSNDDDIRNYCINTNFSLQHFENAIHSLRKYGCDIKIYIMIKPPFLNEKEGIDEAVNSVNYSYSLDIYNVTLCPTRITPNTIAYQLYQFSQYRPPWLWSIIEVLRHTYENGNPRVACLNLRNVDIKSIHPQNCELCSEKVINAIEIFNSDRNFDRLDSLRCGCINDYHLSLEQSQQSNVDIITRIQSFLDLYKMHFENIFNDIK